MMDDSDLEASEVPSEYDEYENDFEEIDDYNEDAFEAYDSQSPTRKSSPSKNVSFQTKLNSSAKSSNNETSDYYSATFDDESKSFSPRHSITSKKLPIRRDSSASSRRDSSPSRRDSSPTRQSILKSSPVKLDSTQLARQPKKPEEVAIEVEILKKKISAENEKLKDQNMELIKKQYELAGEINFSQKRQRDEKKLAAERSLGKKQRANERRLQYEEKLIKTRQLSVELEKQNQVTIAERDSLQAHLEESKSRIKELEGLKESFEQRNEKLSENLQATLSNLQDMSIKLDNVITEKNKLSVRFQEQGLQHKIEIRVVETTAQVEIQALQESLEREKRERIDERKTLPSNYEQILNSERKRFEFLERQLGLQKKEMMERFEIEKNNLRKENNTLRENSRIAIEKAECRMRDELSKVNEERELLSTHRKALFDQNAQKSSQLHQEKVEFESIKKQFEKERSLYLNEKAELMSKVEVYKVKHEQYLEELRNFEWKKAEVMKMSTEIFDKSKELNDSIQRVDELKMEVSRLKSENSRLIHECSLKNHLCDENSQYIEVEKRMIEKKNFELQTEKKSILKQKYETRRLFEETKKLEQLILQQASMHASEFGANRQAYRNTSNIFGRSNVPEMFSNSAVAPTFSVRPLSYKSYNQKNSVAHDTKHLSNSIKKREINTSLYNTDPIDFKHENDCEDTIAQNNEHMMKQSAKLNKWFDNWKEREQRKAKTID